MTGLALALVGRVLAEIPGVVEWHRNIVFPRLVPILQSISASSVSTVGEVGASVLVALAAVALVLRRTAVVGILALLAGLLAFAFYGAWGLAYSYPALSTRLIPLRPTSVASPSAVGLMELSEMSARLVAHASAAAVSEETPEAGYLARVNLGLSDGFARLPKSIEAAPLGGAGSGSFKLSRVSFALSRLGLSGYYFPWTGEAQINAEMPRSLWARVGAHEMAHQGGFARENEATVVGVLACLGSKDDTVRYSGALGLFVSLDKDLSRAEPQVRQGLWAALPGRALDDLRREAAFWKAREGVASSVSEKVNDTYLKAQGIKEGVASYSETTLLFMKAVDAGLVDLGRAPSR